MTDRSDYIAGLRELADRLERHPDCPLPYDGTDSPLTWILDTREDVAAVARVMGRARKERDYKDGLQLVGSLHGLSWKVLTFGGVCERVQVGTRTVEREEVVTPAQTRTVTVTEPVYETRCPESILAGSDGGPVVDQVVS